MRIESPVGCPTSAGDPAAEKAVPDGSAGLFTSILDCFRALASCPASANDAARETPAAAGKTVDRDQTGPDETSSFPAMRDAAAPRLDGIRVDDSRLRPGLQESSGICADPDMAASAGAPFNLAMPGLNGNGQLTPAISDTAARQTGGKSLEPLPATKAGMPAVLQQADMHEPGFDIRAGFRFDLSISQESDDGHGEDESSTVAGPLAPPFDSANAENDHGAASPRASTTAAGGTAQPSALQAAAALVIDACFLRADSPLASDGKSPVLSPVSARSASGTLLNGGTEPMPNSPAASATAWMPLSSVSATKANTSQPGSRTAKSAMTPQPTAPMQDVGGYTKLNGLPDGEGPNVVANVDGHQTGASLLVQKLADKALSPTPGQQADRQATGGQVDSRPSAADPGAEAHPQSQTGSDRLSGPPKAAAGVDSAALAAELERVSAGPGRLRTTFEGSAREASAGSYLSGTARDAQTAPQPASGVKDLKAPAFVFEVAERISAVVTGARGEVTIQLKPDQFGRMNIVAESGASGIVARITTESASLKQYLESNLPVLQQALHDQGLRVERIDVQVQEGLSQQQSPNQWQHGFGHAPGGHDSERSPRITPSAAVQPGDAASEITLDAAVMGALHPNSTFHTIA